MSIFTPFSKGELIPQEERLEVIKKKGNLKIGIPKEDHKKENRIALTPDAVAVLISNGYEVIIESLAGKGSNFSDNEYSEVGAQIAYDRKEVLSQPIILKVEPPSLQEISEMEQDSYLISSLQMNTRSKKYFERLAKKKITALAFEFIRDKHNDLSLVRLLSEIAGTSSVLIAAELLSNTNGGKGLLLGGITGVRPTEVVIIGAGTVGENAARAAMGLGASVRVFDNSLTKLRRLQDILGVRLATSTLDPKELSKALIRCDIALGCLKGEVRCPTIVSETMVSKMKQGAVIVDVSIDTGGVFETSEITTHDKSTIVKYGVIHYGVPNITSRVARTSSKALSNFFLNYFMDLADEGGFERLLSINNSVRSGIYMYKGRVTSLSVSRWFEFPYHDINLLIMQ